MVTPDTLEREITLHSAVLRFDDLRARSELAFDDPGDSAAGAQLTRAEALELLALSEVITRKASYGRQLDIRTAREAGASWSQIGAALGTSKQAAWESHTRWIDDQAAQHESTSYTGLDGAAASAARSAAGTPDS